MRLIDADALRDRLQNLATIEGNQGVRTYLSTAYEECADMVDEQPTIEIERKKGKWIDLRCDQCGQVDYSKPTFCPNCGADMRGGEQDGRDS